MDWEDRFIIQEYRADLLAEVKKWTYINRSSSTKKDFGPLARQAEYWVARKIQLLGYYVAFTPGNSPFDLWAWNDDGLSARIEVKIATYQPYRTGGRYQACIRNHQHDLLVFVARNGKDWPFIIPGPLVPKTNLTIWTACPGESKTWQNYLEAWDYLHLAIVAGQQRGWQLPLF